MGPVIKLLQAIRGLTKSGAIKSVDDAYRLAQRELGERFSRYQNQIKDAFNQGQKEITKITNKPTADIIPFRKKEGIESLSKGKVKGEGEVIEASFKPGMDKRGKVVEESPSQASGVSPLMKRLSEGAQMLKGMKQSGMDPTVALTKTLARSMLNKKGIEIPDRADPIEVLVENFGADVLMDTKNVADELLELQRMGKGTKSIDEVLELEGMFDIPINKNAPKGLSQDELRQIKKEVDQEKMFEDFDPTDREPNSEGGINTLTASMDDPFYRQDSRNELSLEIFNKPIDLLTPEEMDMLDEEAERLMQKFSSDDMNERLLEKLYEDFLDQGLSPEDAKKAAEEAFRERAADGGRMGYAIGSLPKGIQALVKGINKKFGKGTMKTADEIDQPEKTTQQLISEFESRNKPDAITMESREILDVPEVPEGFSLSKEKLMAKFPEIEESFADDMMDMDKDMQGRIIKMLENRRLDPEAYDRLLKQYGDTLEFQSKFDEVVRRKNNNQGGLNYLMGM